MPRFDLYSKRLNDLAKSGQSDVYQYDDVPSIFRNQLLNIASSAFGEDILYSNHVGHYSNPRWVWIDNTYSHEMGIRPIGGPDHTPSAIRDYYMRCSNAAAIDITEVIIYKIEDTTGDIGEVNYRLRETGMGYQFEGAQLTRVDSQIIHQEVVKPALTLLSRAGFEGAQQEFFKAHAHYRIGQNKEAIAMAANALESTFKGIFDLKGWTYNKGSRISDLVKVAKSNALWPDYLDNSFDQLVATLQNGLPKIRDNDASHGQGAALKAVPTYLAAYALHLAASKIVFIVSAADGPS